MFMDNAILLFIVGNYLLVSVKHHGKIKTLAIYNLWFHDRKILFEITGGEKCIGSTYYPTRTLCKDRESMFNLLKRCKDSGLLLTAMGYAKKSAKYDRTNWIELDVVEIKQKNCKI